MEIKKLNWILSLYQRGWLGMAKMSCILRHRGIQLILSYTWARPVFLVAGKGRGGMFLFLLFLHFHSCSFFFPCPSLSSPRLSLLSLFSVSPGDNTKWPTRVDMSLNPNTVSQWFIPKLGGGRVVQKCRVCYATGAFFCFFTFIPCPSLSSFLLSLLSLFSLSLGDDTKWPTKVDVSLNPNTKKKKKILPKLWKSEFVCFTAQSTHWGHVQCSQFT